MNKEAAKECLRAYLEENPNQKPTEGFKLGEPIEQNVNGDVFYIVSWLQDSGVGAKGGYTYCVMPDGQVMLPRGGSWRPISVEEIYTDWQSAKH